MVVAPGVGLDAAMEATGAQQGIIAIKRKHADLVELLSGLTAGTPHSLLLLDNFYPAGDEQVLIFEATGRTVPPLSLPRAVGCLVSNVGTLVSLAESLKGQPVTLRTVTVTGEVAKPAVFTVPIGTAVTECIDFCGGAALSDWVLVLGGPVMGTASPGWARSSQLLINPPGTCLIRKLARVSPGRLLKE